MVMGVVCRHPLDAGGNAPHRLDLRWRGRPAPFHSQVVPFAILNPFRLPALSTMSLTARIAPSSPALESLLCPWSPDPVLPCSRHGKKG